MPHSHHKFYTSGMYLIRLDPQPKHQTPVLNGRFDQATRSHHTSSNPFASCIAHKSRRPELELISCSKPPCFHPIVFQSKNQNEMVSSLHIVCGRAPCWMIRRICTPLDGNQAGLCAHPHSLHHLAAQEAVILLLYHLSPVFSASMLADVAG